MGQVWHEETFPGLYTVGMDPIEDSRGAFHKILAQMPQEFDSFKFDEIYWSISQAGVARGMHFQIPPHHGRKLVFVASGAVIDLVIDLRVGSPTFQKVWEKELTPQSKGVLIPAGCAHGFLVTDAPAVLVYAQEGAYDKDSDTGVNLRSCQISSDVSGFQLSARDHALPMLEQFVSPFEFDASKFFDWENR